MHSYQHNIKTFNHATRHLTRVERSLYRDLIELYYDTEQPLTSSNFDRLCRLVLAQTEEEKTAVQVVLNEFFVLTGDVYSHDYCDEQIEKYNKNQSAKAYAGIASAAARKQRSQQRKRSRTGVEHVLNEDSSSAANQEPLTTNQDNKTLLSSGDDESVKLDYQGIVDLYHKTLPELPMVKTLTAKRRSAMRTCAATKPKYSGLDFWQAYFSAVKKSDFLMGRQTGWICSFDFLVTHSKFVKVIEGVYK